MPERLLVFKSTGEDYSGFAAACEWLRENGYSFGFLEGKNPIGIIEGKHLIQRWSKIGILGRRKLDGTIEFPYGAPRMNSVIVRLK